MTNKGFQVDQERYQGPLETIIYLLRKRQLHVSDVNLAHIADEFSEYVSSKEESLPELSDFIRVMSVLLLIKTKALLPKETLGVDDEETIAQFEADLSRIEVLQTLQQEIFQTQKTYISRKENPKTVPQGFISDTTLTVDRLYKMVKTLTSETQREDTFARVAVAKLANLKTTIENLERRMLSLKETNLKSIIPDHMPTNEKVVNFIAILELLKQNRISLRQNEQEEMLQYGNIQTPEYGLER